MADLKHFLKILVSLSIVLAVVKDATGTEDNRSLGYERSWRGLQYLGMIYNKTVEKIDCCQACKTKFANTEAFGFEIVETDDEILSKYCDCYKRKQPDGQWPATVKTEYWSGLCGQNSVDVDGGVGRGRRFIRDLGGDTVNKLGEVHAEDQGECCQECASVHPSTQMYSYSRRRKFCYCEETIPGKRPATSAWKDYAGICGCNEKDHGIGCCSTGNSSTTPQFTPGDNAGKEEIFIQANQYNSTCANTCKSLHPNSVGVTESVTEKYWSGSGRSKNKCWCEFGEAQLNYGNADYQTCMF